ncbi:hypothetical protein T01_10117 [Trichinella spiralis]|uniref:Uncharacterized protein n=1 Tax=Trichinella spiralis TaxID=6334 RepID=A0A0V1B397_TRISP|nr:hypothetical protein T01_10117 [Trichinella spiralis]
MPKKSIFGEEAFSRKLQNFMGFRASWTWFFFQKSPKTFFQNFRLSQPRTKLYCNEISKQLFPEYHDRISTERTCCNMYIYSDFSIDIDLEINLTDDSRLGCTTACFNVHGNNYKSHLA